MANPTGTDPNTAIDPYTQLANFFTSTAGGRANGRLQQALLDLQRGQLGNQQFGQTSQNVTAAGQQANQRFGQQSTNALNDAEFGLKQPAALAGNAVRGDILANAQDANVQAPPGVPMGHVSGGLRPSLLSAGTRELGGNMARNALLEQMKGPAHIAYPDAPTAPTYPTAPTLPDLPQASGLDSFLNAAGGASGVASALNGLLGGGQGSGGSFDAGKVGGALASGLKKLFGGSGGSDPGGFVGPMDPNATGGFVGPVEGMTTGPNQPTEPGSSTGLSQDEIDALTSYFGDPSQGDARVDPQAGLGPGAPSDVYQMFGPGGNGMSPGNPNGMSPEEIAALGGYPEDPSGWF